MRLCVGCNTVRFVLCSKKGKSSLLGSLNQIRHNTALADQLCVVCQRLENIGLAERELHFSSCIIKGDDEVLNLYTVSAAGFNA